MANQRETQINEREITIKEIYKACKNGLVESQKIQLTRLFGAITSFLYNNHLPSYITAHIPTVDDTGSPNFYGGSKTNKRENTNIVNAIP